MSYEYASPELIARMHADRALAKATPRAVMAALTKIEAEAETLKKIHGNVPQNVPQPILVKGAPFRRKRAADLFNIRPLPAKITKAHVQEMLAEGLSWDTISRFCLGYSAPKMLKKYFTRMK